MKHLLFVKIPGGFQSRPYKTEKGRKIAFALLKKQGRKFSDSPFFDLD